MKVLVIGSGGREHALVWKLRQSSRVSQIFCAPGNGGIAEEAVCLAADVKSIDSLVALAEQVRPDLTVVGPEISLSLGVVDEFTRRGWQYLRTEQGSGPAGVEQEFRQGISAALSHSDGAFRHLRLHRRSHGRPAALSRTRGSEGGRPGCGQRRGHLPDQGRGGLVRPPRCSAARSWARPDGAWSWKNICKAMSFHFWF